MSDAAPTRSIWGSLLLIGGGAAAVGGAIFAVRKHNKIADDVQNAIAGTAPPLEMSPPDEPGQPAQPEEGTGGYVRLMTTGYWPYSARPDEVQMEGGTVGAAGWRGKRVVDPATGKRIVLTTVEMHRADPIKYPAVSLSGDADVWPWGQKIMIPWSDGKPIVGRVVDTGSHFHGIKKVYRYAGLEPIDVCVLSSKSKVPGKLTAQVIAGDNWEGGKGISAAGLKGQTVTAGESSEIIDVFTIEDHAALARALESELGGRPREEQIVAGWAVRNRADLLGLAVSDMLAPKGEFGSPSRTGGYASTRRPSTEKSREAAASVLGADKSMDPTDGAVEFWNPAQQEKLRALGDVYRAAKSSGDEGKAAKYARYAGYGSEGDVRNKHARDGLRLIDVVGSVEILGKIR